MSDITELSGVTTPVARPYGWVWVREIRCSGCGYTTVSDDWLTTVEMVRFISENYPCDSCGGQRIFATEPEETTDAT